MEEEEENMCDGAIYTPIPVSALSVDPRADYLRGMHIEWEFLSGGGLQLGGVISEVNLQWGVSPAFGSSVHVFELAFEHMHGGHFEHRL